MIASTFNNLNLHCSTVRWELVHVEGSQIADEEGEAREGKRWSQGEAMWTEEWAE